MLSRWNHELEEAEAQEQAEDRQEGGSEGPSGPSGGQGFAPKSLLLRTSFTLTSV